MMRHWRQEFFKVGKNNQAKNISTNVPPSIDSQLRLTYNFYRPLLFKFLR